ncbi:PREDICTED: uncharacterized protein LOC108972370 [Bactrocera latifrons]|uniref:Uncharacterized protein n=1 Tax=Bactrocera latifrons TaxID=174628 RepID=A0A0K8WH36_BACLA|nr:PREDICTED: uncharacterized protein LOC108972370 [Bactrocera latifrons]
MAKMLPGSICLLLTIVVLLLASNMSGVSGRELEQPASASDPISVVVNQPQTTLVIGSDFVKELITSLLSVKLAADGNENELFKIVINNPTEKDKEKSNENKNDSSEIATTKPEESSETAKETDNSESTTKKYIRPKHVQDYLDYLDNKQNYYGNGWWLLG